MLIIFYGSCFIVGLILFLKLLCIHVHQIPQMLFPFAVIMLSVVMSAIMALKAILVWRWIRWCCGGKKTLIFKQTAFLLFHIHKRYKLSLAPQYSTVMGQ